jgi:hypothetical protein
MVSAVMKVINNPFMANMKRREFLRYLGLGLAASWSGGLFSWPLKALAGDEKEIRLALLADAHLKNGDGNAPEARFLARAVAEIRALNPPPDLILFAGDLAHAADPRALDLGMEILADLPAPPLLVRGEGDGAPEPRRRRFGPPWFSHSFRGINLVGLNSHPVSTPQGPAFAIGLEQQLRLAAALARLDPAAPLIILSHAPLAQIFRPWRQWTIDAPALALLLAPFSSVICLHGHVHHSTFLLRPGTEEPKPLTSSASYASWEGVWGRAGTAYKKVSGPSPEYSIPSTAWPLPHALQGTPALPCPGLAPYGCGWSLLTLRPDALRYQPRIWT